MSVSRFVLVDQAPNAHLITIQLADEIRAMTANEATAFLWKRSLLNDLRVIALSVGIDHARRIGRSQIVETIQFDR